MIRKKKNISVTVTTLSKTFCDNVGTEQENVRK